MKLYKDDGYPLIDDLLKTGATKIIGFGGRGAGKSFMVIDHLLENSAAIGHKFMYIRRTKSAVDTITASPDLSPFNEPNKIFGRHIELKRASKELHGIYDADKENQQIGLIASLGDVAKIRGFDGHEYDEIFYDEFIKEPMEVNRRGEYEALMNLYETINRNRELKGERPVRLFMMSNADQLNNPIFSGFGIISKIEQMKKRGQEWSLVHDGDLLIIDYSKSPIVAKKRETRHYKTMGENDYYRRMMRNEFTELDDEMIRTRTLGEYVAKAVINGICVYKHKSENTFYISPHIKDSPKRYGRSEREKEMFRHNYPLLYSAYISRRMYFENFDTLTKFLEIYD